MKILSTEKFQNKLITLEKPSRDILVKFIDSIKDYSYEKLIDNLSYANKTGEIAVYKLGDIRIFYDFTESSGREKIMLFLDLTVDVPNVSTSKNPRFNSSINPRFNSSINPKFNSSINPRFNSSINPRFNSSINPKFNSSINPKFNSSINPRFNSSINPKFNSSINPRFNSSINPKFNPAFSGYFNYDLNLLPLEYVIPINDNEMLLFFDFANNFVKYAVKGVSGYFAIFNVNDNEWIGYCVANSQSGSNYFDIDGNWIGFLN